MNNHELDEEVVETLLIQFMNYLAATQGIYFSKERSIIHGFINELRRMGEVSHE